LLFLFCVSCVQQKKVEFIAPTAVVEFKNPPPPPPPVSTYYHVLMTGQSLSTGAWGVDTISGSYSAQQPYSNYMLSQPSTNANLQGPLGTIAPLIPLVEPYYEFAIKRHVETPVSGMANTLAALDDPINPSYGVLATAHGYGAQPYSQIKKNPVLTSPPFLMRYNIGQQQIAECYQEITTNPIFTGTNYVPLGVAVVHGETDQRNGNAAYYEMYLNEFQSDYELDMNQFLLANNEPLISSFPMYITQMNARGPYEMAIAQLDASRNNDDIFMVGPTYQYTFYDKTHLHGAEAYRQLGENIGKVIHKVGILNENWKPLSPELITYNNKLITIHFHVPVGDLVFDAPEHSIDSITGAKSYFNNYGFSYVDDTNSANILPGGIALGVDKKSVLIYLDNAPTGTNPRIKYAAQYYPRVTSGASAGCQHNDVFFGVPCYGGNLRDSDSSVSPSVDGSGKPLYNWCVTFDEPVQVDIFSEIVLQGPYDPTTGLMASKMAAQGILPTVEPYSGLGYNFVNAEEIGTTISSSVLNATGADQPVDWVIIEVLHAKLEDSVVQAQTGIVQRDGDIVDPSGVSGGVRFNSLITRDYHLRIKHRNHLQVGTLHPIRINGHQGKFNFSTSTNTTYQKPIGNLKGMWAGDANLDSGIDEGDRFLIQNQAGTAGYYSSDINLDGVVNASDRSLVWNNRKLFSGAVKTGNN